MQELLNFIKKHRLISVTKDENIKNEKDLINRGLDLGLIEVGSKRNIYILTAQGRQAQEMGFDKWMRKKQGKEDFETRKSQAEYQLTQTQIRDIQWSKGMSISALIISIVVALYEIFGK